PAEGYRWGWGIYPWLEGENPTVDNMDDAGSLARDLARFISALHRIDLPGGPSARRGAPLEVQDRPARAALNALRGMIDTDAATAAWDAALEASPWPGPPVWVHGALLPGN